MQLILVTVKVSPEQQTVALWDVVVIVATRTKVGCSLEPRRCCTEIWKEASCLSSLPCPIYWNIANKHQTGALCIGRGIVLCSAFHSNKAFIEKNVLSFFLTGRQ